MNDFSIEKERLENWYIGEDGDLTFNYDKARFKLINKNRETISHSYYCMFSLGNDHFAVCDLISEAIFLSDYDIINGDYEVTAPKMKWGVIRVSRDDSGIIIPFAEVMVVPYLYDRISPNNLKTATVKSNGKFSYIDLDINRSSYGRQLVPCVLDHAVPFGIGVEGFAECGVEGVTGYLPREGNPYYIFESFGLLTKEQAKKLSASLVSEVLTDTKIGQEKKLTLGKI